MKETYPKAYLYKRIVDAKLFIDSHFNEPLDLDNIADSAFFSKFHFTRLFKSIYAKTPHQYLTFVRIENAKLSLQKNISVTETCYAVGFESISSFTALFKRFTKKSPAAWQQHYRVQMEQILEKPLHFIPNCFAEQKGWKQNSNFE